MKERMRTMNKTAIKNFAIWARNKLIADIQYRAGLMGITADGIKDPLPQSTGTMEFYDIGTSEPYAITGEAIGQRKKLIEIIRQKEKDSDYPTAYKYILEEVAYTWFNRLIAIRFMEVNDYLPSHIRVLSSESGKVEPDLVTTPFDAELDFTPDEEETILRLKTENALDELFRLLFIKQCNALGEILPALFEKTSDYTEVLLNLSVVDQEGVVYHLIHDIEEKYFDIKQEGQVEIIGWLYQYYNTEPKNAAFAKSGKITKDEIPAVTQLFTPDWIVRYMVQNSLGRLFIDKRKNEGVFADGRGMDEMTWDEAEEKRIANEETIAGQMGWKYYLPEAAQTKEVREQLDEIHQQSEYKDVRDIKVIDPCMGSGHILVYAFDVLMQLYEDAGYSQRDAAQSILQNNLYGVDIDERAAQLAYFAVMMKARQYDRRIFARNIRPHVYAIQESNNISRTQLKYFGWQLSELERNMADTQMRSLLDALHDAKEYGSIIQFEQYDWELLYHFVLSCDYSGQMDFDAIGLENLKDKLFYLVQLGATLAHKYDVVVTNPPYMGSSNMDAKLSEFVKKHYPDSKSDLFAVFIERCGQMTTQNRYQAMITQHAWMFLSSFEKLRAKLLLRDTVNMAHLGPRAFEEIGGEVVQTTSFVLRNSHLADYKGTYCRLIEPTTQQGKEDMFLAGENRYTAQQSNFSKIPGSPVAYWVSRSFVKNYIKHSLVGNNSHVKKGMFTGANDLFFRLWFEPAFHSILFGVHEKDEIFDGQYVPMNSGGEYRRWYGNRWNIIKFDKHHYDMITANKGHRNPQYYFKKSAVWTKITTGKFSLRLSEKGFINNDASMAVYEGKVPLEKIGGLLNSKVAQYYLSSVNESLNYTTGNVASIPYIDGNDEVSTIVNRCIHLSKSDWDSFESSWDFAKHPLIRPLPTVADAFTQWKTECDDRFIKLKANEEELNRIFIDIYGLQDELTPEVADKDITVHRIYDTRDDVPESMKGSNYVRTKRDEIISLLSYAVGCMFGRYSLDVPGLAYAGGEWDSAYKHDPIVLDPEKTDGSTAVLAGDYVVDKDGQYHLCTFVPDKDGILPITDEEYLGDDIVTRLCSWLKVVYGADTLEENLDFIAKALGNKGNSSREIIRNYFLKDFFKDHCKIYQKRPIYWLFDSGKQNGFKALIYLHRYTPDTIGNLRVDYLHKMQRVYESEINRMQDMIDHSTNSREVAASTKRKEKLQKQLKECRDYDEMIAHLALSRIELDLDDGVKVNYEKVQTANDGKKYLVLAKI